MTSAEPLAAPPRWRQVRYLLGGRCAPSDAAWLHAALEQPDFPTRVFRVRATALSVEIAVFSAYVFATDQPDLVLVGPGIVAVTLGQLAWQCFHNAGLSVRERALRRVRDAQVRGRIAARGR